MPEERARPLRVGIFAAVPESGRMGGTEQHVMGLVRALGRLPDGDEEYVILTDRSNPHWLDSYLGRNQIAKAFPITRVAPSLRRVLLSFARANLSAALKRRVRTLLNRGPAGIFVHGPHDSDGSLESLALDVVHFPYQHFIRTSIPSIFNPHDLLHLHYPCFFPLEQVAAREAYYPIACRAASQVVVPSSWVARDVVEKYGLEPQRVQVIPHAPVTEAYVLVNQEQLDLVRRQWTLPRSFAFYPAQTWPHKNHLRLLRALAHLRDERALSVNLVCTGWQNEFWPKISQEIRRLGLERQVHFLGFVPPGTLRAIYRLASFVVLPTLFEGGCFPMLEAFREEVPVACAAATHLPEQAGDAALLFDPTSELSIAGAVERMALDQALRETLRQRGTQRVQLFTWDRVARTHRALYRRLSGRALTADEETLLRLPLPSDQEAGRECVA